MFAYLQRSAIKAENLHILAGILRFAIWKGLFSQLQLENEFFASVWKFYKLIKYAGLNQIINLFFIEFSDL